MIRLGLVRHAKSDWGHPQLDDHDRPLNARGLRDAPVMAARLADSGFSPDVIVASTALRARTTAQFFGEQFAVQPRLLPELYGASADELLEVAARQGAASVLVVAHDPGMSALAGRLSDEIGHMPTCAVATFTWDQDDWDVATALAPDDWTFDTPR
ncbi:MULTISPECIES: histidine phosphatase family protein [unclassified Microbacterium]|uniref:SixA phosphatase family protein n=1 Tax=unclassified Microbacterium TaxID=2609290 RepID=UPI00214CFFD3|nr:MULTISPECIES: histidine phosphatase family protein [unclassified Microbacterium]MCR2784218.1 histidine phosphatase family protein [Microbacterium sp. zg.B96]MDL5350871.1 histidine phosphatase family protein [Microbacterium sp. zg-YB36]WIM14951.1 histidine phosphatase family protein [Microbacterium sp. zg-B96]